MRRVLLLVTVLLSGCGGAAQAPAPAPEAAAPMTSHVHGVGVDGGRALVATHGGLLVEGERVGPQQDLMGFTVAGPGVLLASGHPGPSQAGEPPVLGLLRSTDGGRTWTSVALSGQADLHAMAASGEAVYGADASTGALLASADGGRTWARRTPPGSVLALAADPADPRRLAASTSVGVAESRDGGARWKLTDARSAGLLAWSRRGLHLAGPDGSLQRSTDGGRTWTPAGAIGAPAVALAADGDGLVAALEDGSVRRVP